MGVFFPPKIGGGFPPPVFFKALGLLLSPPKIFISIHSNNRHGEADTYQAPKLSSLDFFPYFFKRETPKASAKHINGPLKRLVFAT